MTSKATVTALFADDQIITENSNEAREFYNQSRFGVLLEDGRVRISLLETVYLVEKKKLMLVNLRGGEIILERFLKRAKKLEPRFWIKYCVFKDIRDRGYIIKTALKFGADFRVYDRGIKPGEDHAKWVVFPVSEIESLTWHEFAAKNRVAHSTKKRLLIGVVDDENDVSYWECRWLRP